MQIFKTIFRTLIGAAAIAMILWFAAPMFMHVINVGNLMGIVLCVWVLVLCIAPLHRALKRLFFRNGFTRFLYRFVNAMMVAFLLYGTVCTTFITFALLQTPPPNATAVVFGAQVTGTGKPSRILNKRIEAAARYLTDNPGTNAVLSGGKGVNEGVSEADCMYNELVARGIAPDRLFKEDKATDTEENLRYSREVIESNELNHDIVLVTDGFHQFRAQLTARKYGFVDAGAVPANTEWIFIPTYTVREWFALPTLWLK